MIINKILSQSYHSSEDISEFRDFLMKDWLNHMCCLVKEFRSFVDISEKYNRCIGLEIGARKSRSPKILNLVLLKLQ